MVPGCSCRAGGPLARAEGREVGVARLGGILYFSGWMEMGRLIGM